MMQIFRKSGQAVSTALDIVNDTVDDVVNPIAPLHIIPDNTSEFPASIGDDINLILLVKELGARQKLKMTKRREELMKELNMLDKELGQLDVLLDAVNSLGRTL